MYIHIQVCIPMAYIICMHIFIVSPVAYLSAYVHDREGHQKVRSTDLRRGVRCRRPWSLWHLPQRALSSH